MGVDLPGAEVDGDLVLRGVGDGLLQFLSWRESGLARSKKKLEEAYKRVEVQGTGGTDQVIVDAFAELPLGLPALP